MARSCFSSSARDSPYPLFISIVVVPSRRAESTRVAVAAASALSEAARISLTDERIPPPPFRMER
jgi:hypothetical protein